MRRLLFLERIVQIQTNSGSAGFESAAVKSATMYHLNILLRLHRTGMSGRFSYFIRIFCN